MMLCCTHCVPNMAAMLCPILSICKPIVVCARLVLRPSALSVYVCIHMLVHNTPYSPRVMAYACCWLDYPTGSMPVCRKLCRVSMLLSALHAML